MSDDNAPATLAGELFRPTDRQISRCAATGVPPCPADWDRGKSWWTLRFGSAKPDRRSAAPLDDRPWDRPRSGIYFLSLTALSSAIRVATTEVG
jgi:hypothetical protein